MVDKFRSKPAEDREYSQHHRNDADSYQQREPVETPGISLNRSFRLFLGNNGLMPDNGFRGDFKLNWDFMLN